MISKYQLKMLLQKELKKAAGPFFLLGIDMGTKFIGFSKGDLRSQKTEVSSAL